jgi:hypothetical protein
VREWSQGQREVTYGWWRGCNNERESVENPRNALGPEGNRKSSKECGICWSYYNSPIFLILRMKLVMHNLLEIV